MKKVIREIRFCGSVWLQLRKKLRIENGNIQKEIARNIEIEKNKNRNRW